MDDLQALFRRAVSCVVRTLQGPLVSDDPRLEATRLENRKLAIIGGFCVQHYLGYRLRQTQVFLPHSCSYEVCISNIYLAGPGPYD